MKLVRIIGGMICLLLLVGVAAFGEEPKVQPRPKLKTRNILLVTSDGLRWQEVFGGADSSLFNKQNGGVADPALMKSEFGGDKPEARRKLLMPFLWSVVARQGQIYGNVNAGSEVLVTNGRNFSYPGYNEILTGRADPKIDSNDKVPNQNVTVLEWLNGQDEYRNRVAAFGSWDVFPFIINRSRSRVRVVAGWHSLVGMELSREELLISRLMAETPRMWEECCYDSFTFHAALEYFKRQRPRVLYIALGETDEFAHMGRYDQYLRAARNADYHLRHLWDTVQAMPDYRGTTTMIVTTDHGRGDAPVEWKNHGAKTAGSDKIWIAVIGPDTPALGERTNVPPLVQGQVAATVAALLGLDFQAFAPKAAPPIVEVVGREPRGTRE
jgi:Type I phosphodiesterase / nucleotide pyrophosphatase